MMVWNWCGGDGHAYNNNISNTNNDFNTNDNDSDGIISDGDKADDTKMTTRLR